MVSTRTNAGKAAFAAAIAAVAIGTLVLIGWAFEIAVLKSIFLSTVTMNPVTALAVILAGTSLGLSCCANDAKDRQLRALYKGVARACAASVLTIGLLRLLALIFGWDAGVDQWLFRLQVSRQLPLPSRIAPAVAFNFVLLGCALLVVKKSRRVFRLCIEFAAILAGSGALLAVVGYVFNATSFYRVGPFIPMALNTAVAFLLLAAGILLSHTDSGFMKVFAGNSAGGTMARRLMPAVVLIPILFGWLELQGELAGVFKSEMGNALFAIAHILVFTLLVCWSVSVLSRIDAQRKLADEIVKRVASIVENSDDAIISKTLLGIITSWNPAAERMFGYTAAEIIGRPVQTLIPMDRADEEAEILAGFSRGEVIRHLETVRVRKNGQCLDVSATISPIKDSEGKVVGASKIVHDITERKKAENALRESNEKFQQLADNITDAFWIRSPDMRELHYLSRAFEVIWGRSMESLYANPDAWPQFTVPEDRARVLEAFAALRGDAPRLDIEYRILRPGGEMRWIRVRGFQVRDSAQKLVRLSGVVSDITDRKAAESHVLNLNVELEQRVKKRTEQLSAVNNSLVTEIAERKQVEIDLVKARQAAEEASKAKSEFLATMSHEIRTPMNGIIGMNYLVKQTQLTLKQSGYVSKIDLSAHRLLDIINDILDFSKVEAGKIELEQTEFNLDEVLAQLDHAATLLAHRKALTFKISVAENTPMLLVGDPVRLGQVLLNLASNAIKFTATGGVDVAVALVEKDNAHLALQFKVRDTGIGIDPLHIGKLFEPFSQSDSTTTRRFGGTGLGLAISKRFVQLMGGAFDVQSTPGQGSTFAFTSRFMAGASDKKSSASRRALLSDQHALLIDGNADSRTWTTDLLSKLSIKTVGAETCAEASHEIMRLSRAGARGFDLVLLDCTPSGKNCIENAQAMSRECATAGMPPMILIASREMADTQVQLRETGFSGFVVKPVTRSSLFDAVVGALSRKYKAPKVPDTSLYQSLRGARILLVDDNEINQEIALHLLRLVECEIVVVSNGADALTALKNATPAARIAAILMDIQMPEMDGYLTARHIRADKRNERIPIIAMTADAVSGVKEKCLAAGMTDHLTKPINPDELYGTLKKWIDATSPEK